MPVTGGTGGTGKATATGPAAMASPAVIRAAPRLPSTSFGAEDHAAHLGIIIRIAEVVGLLAAGIKERPRS